MKLDGRFAPVDRRSAPRNVVSQVRWRGLRRGAGARPPGYDRGMANTPSTEDIKQAAQALFVERVGAVTALADAARERAAKQAEAAEAEQREVAAWAERAATGLD